MNSQVSLAVSTLEIFSRVILIPWTFHHLQIALHLSINRAISINGFIWSSFMAGRVIGRNIFFGYSGVMTPKLCYLTCSLMAVSFLFLSISTRISIICLCYSFIGFCGGIIRACYPPNDEITPRGTSHSLSSSTSSSSSSSLLSSSSSFSSISFHQEALALIFVPLFAGLTYNSAVTSRFPALILCIVAALVAGLIFFAQCFCQRRICWGKKQKTLVSSGIQQKSKIKRQTPRKVIDDVNNLDPPQEFLDLCGGNRGAAQKKYHTTLVWKAENDVDAIIDTPQDFFEEILTYYPHAIQGRTRTGGMVCYEQLGKGNASELKKKGVTPDHLLRHFMLRNEFIFQRCYRNYRDGEIAGAAGGAGGAGGADGPPKDDGPLCTRLMTILDVKDIKFSDFSADVIRFIQLSADVMDHHYPGRVERLVICNPPSWFFSIWSVLARVLPESIKKKVVTVDDLSKLDEFIDPKLRPPEYAGTGTPLRESHDHKALVAVAQKWKELEQNELLPSTQTVTPTPPKIITPSSSAPSPQGMWSWFRSNKKGPSAEAFLGETNKFHYDASTGRWILEDDSETMKRDDDHQEEQTTLLQGRAKNHNSNQLKNSTTKQSPKMSQGPMTLDQIEEHGLVLAIQAAHHASRLQQQNISSFSSSNGANFNTLGGSRDSDREESGLNHNPSYSSNQMGTPRERKSGTKSLTRSRSLPSDREELESSDPEDGYVHFEEKPSAELFLVVLGMHLMSCMLLGTLIVALPIWMTMPHRGGGLGYSVKDCAVVISTAGVLILLAQSNSEQRIKVALRAFPVRTFRVGVGSLAFFSFCLTQFGRINRLQFTGLSGNNSSIQIPNPNESSSIGGHFLWFLHILLGIEHFTSPSAESDGNVVSGSFWIPTPSANPLTMLIPGILVGSVLCFAYLTRKSAANLLHISLNSVISSPSKVQHCLSAAAAILAPSTSCLLLRWSHRLHLTHPMNDSFFLTLVGCTALLLYIFSLMLAVRFRGEFGILSDDASVSLYETDSSTQSEMNLRQQRKEKQQPIASLGLTEILTVPFEDIRHLRALFPGGKKTKDTGALSARLFSLKLDLKDA